MGRLDRRAPEKDAAAEDGVEGADEDCATMADEDGEEADGGEDDPTAFEPSVTS